MNKSPVAEKTRKKIVTELIAGVEKIEDVCGVYRSGNTYYVILEGESQESLRRVYALEDDFYERFPDGYDEILAYFKSHIFIEDLECDRFEVLYRNQQG